MGCWVKFGLFFLFVFLFTSENVKARQFKDTPFSEACRNLEIDHDGPALNQNFLDLVAQSESKVDFYQKLSKDPSLRKLNSSFTLVTRSASLDKRNASPDYPRVIGFGGTMVMASVDHPSPNNIRQGQMVEGIAYASKALTLDGKDLKARQLHFFTIDFSKTKPEIEMDVQSCQRCHAGRFNWETYNVWPGTLPSKNRYTQIELSKTQSQTEIRARLEKMLLPENRADYFYDESEEILRRGLDSLLPLMHESARRDVAVAALSRALYDEGLNYNPSTKSWTQHVEVQRELSGIYKTLNFKSFEGSNRELNEFINSLVFDQMSAELETLDTFRSRRLAALAGVMDCGAATNFLGPITNAKLGGSARFTEIMQEVELQIRKQYQAKETILQKYGIHETLNTADLDDVRRLSSLRYLFENDGFDLSSYSPNFFGRSGESSYGFAHVGAGSFGANQFMCYLAPEILSDYQTLAPYFNDQKTIDGYRAHNEGKDVCKMLQELSLKESI